MVVSQARYLASLNFMCTKRNGLPPISVQTQWMKEEIWHLLCIRLVWEGLVPVGSFHCCPIPEEVLALAHLKETEAQECYIVTHGYNWSATEAGLEPSSSVQFRGYLKVVHGSSIPVLKSPPQPTSLPYHHNHYASWSSCLRDFQRLMQNQRSLSGVVSVNRQAKQHGHFP